MKKALKIIGFTLLVACEFIAVWRTAVYSDGYNNVIADFFEKAGYVLLAGVILVSFAFFSRKADRLWAKLLIAFAHSSVYVIALFLENFFYRCVSLNNLSDFLPKITYAQSLMMNLRYYIKHGNPHYMLALLFVMALCAGIIAWRIPKFADHRRAIYQRFVCGEDIKNHCE